MKKALFGILLLSVTLLAGSCKSKESAILKVFVRSSSNQLMNGARVVIIGDQQSNPSTKAFTDTSYTNSSGFTSVNMDDYFNKYADQTTGYFDILVKLNTKNATGYSRCRVHTTSVETIFLPN